MRLFEQKLSRVWAQQEKHKICKSAMTTPPPPPPTCPVSLFRWTCVSSICVSCLAICLCEISWYFSALHPRSVIIFLVTGRHWIILVCFLSSLVMLVVCILSTYLELFPILFDSFGLIVVVVILLLTVLFLIFLIWVFVPIRIINLFQSLSTQTPHCFLLTLLSLLQAEKHINLHHVCKRNKK